MSIKVLYEKGVFKPLEKVRGIKEGEELEINLERHDWNRLAASNKSFHFLEDEPDIYTKDDIVNKENDAQG